MNYKIENNLKGLLLPDWTMDILNITLQTQKKNLCSFYSDRKCSNSKLHEIFLQISVIGYNWTDICQKLHLCVQGLTECKAFLNALSSSVHGLLRHGLLRHGLLRHGSLRHGSLACSNWGTAHWTMVAHWTKFEIEPGKKISS